MIRQQPLTSLFYVLGILFCISFTPLSFAEKQENLKSITVGTGGVTGLYYPTGGAICRLLKKNTNFQCKVLSTGGSVDNIEKLQKDTIQIGIVQSDIQYDVVHGLGKFKGKPDANLRALFALYIEPLTLVTRKDTGFETLKSLTNIKKNIQNTQKSKKEKEREIKTQLKKLKIDIGNPGSGERNTIELLMQELGWTTDMFAGTSQLPGAQRASALCKKDIDAYVYMVGHPSNAMREVARNCSVTFIQIPSNVISDFVKKYPFYTAFEIPSGLYRGIDALTPTIGVSATVVASQALPEETAYQITKNVFEQLETFKRLNTAYQHMTPQSMSQNALSAPLHPGALRYYHESGLIPEKK